MRLDFYDILCGKGPRSFHIDYERFVKKVYCGRPYLTEFVVFPFDCCRAYKIGKMKRMRGNRRERTTGTQSNNSRRYDEGLRSTQANDPYAAFSCGSRNGTDGIFESSLHGDFFTA